MWMKSRDPENGNGTWSLRSAAARFRAPYQPTAFLPTQWKVRVVLVRHCPSSGVKFWGYFSWDVAWTSHPTSSVCRPETLLFPAVGGTPGSLSISQFINIWEERGQTPSHSQRNFKTSTVTYWSPILRQVTMWIPLLGPPWWRAIIVSIEQIREGRKA